jgi:hypothetical protein
MKKHWLMAFLCGVTAVAWAGQITTANLITELMMNDQSANGTLTGMLLGPDFSAHVTFTSNVDPVNLTFSFAAQPGSMYFGQSLQLSGSGVFDSNTGIMSMASSGMLGATQWSTTGAFLVAGDPSGYTYTGNENLSLAGPGPLPPFSCLTTFITSASFIPAGSFKLSIAQGGWTDRCNQDNFVDGTWSALDVYRAVDCGYEIHTIAEPVESFFLHDEGCSPPNGGSGAYTISYSPIPEPGSFLLLASGVLGAAAAHCRRFR